MIDNEKLVTLKTATAELAEWKKELSDKKEVFEVENKFLTDKVKEFTDNISALKQDLTKEALKEFEKDGIKKLDGGIGIQVKKTLSYDTEKAFDYCKENNLCLKFDDKAFNKIAVPLGLDFVTTGTKNAVTFPKEIVIK